MVIGTRSRWITCNRMKQRNVISIMCWCFSFRNKICYPGADKQGLVGYLFFFFRQENAR